MKPEIIIRDYPKIKKVFPDAYLDKKLNFLFFPNVPLPPKFNLPKTPLLLILNPKLDYQVPDAYVDKRLRLKKGEKWVKSPHLDEKLTLKKMLEKGWVKLCIWINWNPNFSLIDFLILVLDYLKNLE